MASETYSYLAFKKDCTKKKKKSRRNLQRRIILINAASRSVGGYYFSTLGSYFQKDKLEQACT